MKLIINLAIFIVCLFAFLFNSCDNDWLDVKADDQQAVPSTIKDFQAILNNEFQLNSEYNSTLAELSSDGHFTTESAFLTSSSNMGINAYTWSNDRLYDNFNWTTGFKRIFSVNVVLDALHKYKPGSIFEEEEINSIKGQALFHRSDAYYRLAQIWVPPYNLGSQNEYWGLPLRLEADVTLPSIRSTVGQTYGQITTDLLEAVDLLPSESLVKTRPYRLSALALLARVYLSMRDYQKAGVFADSCLSINGALMDYNSLPTESNFIGNVNSNAEVTFYMEFITMNFLTTACFVDPDLFSLYEDNDLRKTVFFRTNIDGTISFKGNYGKNDFSLFCGLANDELYLIRAECNARMGKTDLAMKDLNELLRTRWRKVNGVTTYVDQTAMNAADALKKILIERQKELLLRGLRWTDLRRLNFEEVFKKTLTRTIGGNTYTLEPGSFRYTFPIPSDIISKSGMQQNPGW